MSKNYKLHLETPQIKIEKYVEAGFQGCFSQVQKVNPKFKVVCTYLGYLSIDPIVFRNFQKTDFGERKSTVKK